MSRKSTDENVLRIFISVRNILFLKEDNHKVLVLTLMNFPHQRLSTSDKSLKVSIFVIRWICLYINIDVMLLMWKKIKGLSFRIPINTLYLMSCSSYNSYNRNLSYRIIIWLRKKYEWSKYNDLILLSNLFALLSINFSFQAQLYF